MGETSTYTITDKVYDRAMSMSLNKKTVAFEPEFDSGTITMTSEYFEKLYGRRADRVRKLYNGTIPSFLYQFYKPQR